MVKMEIDLEVSEQSSGQSVGVLLRETRLSSGLSLLQVSDVLRIRKHFLEAIEENRFDMLPSAAYVAGFVRNYAEHLGLDGEEVIRRFKLENNIYVNKVQYKTLATPQEREFPKKSLLLASLIAIVTTYFIWHGLGGHRTSVELVTEIPDKLAVQVTPLPTHTPSSDSDSVPGNAASVPLAVDSITAKAIDGGQNYTGNIPPVTQYPTITPSLVPIEKEASPPARGQ